MKTVPYLLHALSPLHAGTGQSVSVIDLPIARMRATGIPFVPGSSVKGVLRDARRVLPPDEWLAIFGPEPKNAAEHAGALVVSDARLLALPVRCFRGTFAWVTSPLLLELARRDLVNEKNVPAPLGPMRSREALVGKLKEDPKQNPATSKKEQATPNEDPATSVNAYGAEKNASIYLEDIDIPVKADARVAAWAKALAPHVAPEGNALMFESRFVVVDDETMTFLWETATQVDTRVRLDPDTRTVAQGALWTEESLPPETLLLGLMTADQIRRKGSELMTPAVIDKALPAEEILQFGGKATVGRGRCRIMQLSFATGAKS